MGALTKEQSLLRHQGWEEKGGLQVQSCICARSDSKQPGSKYISVCVFSSVGKFCQASKDMKISQKFLQPRAHLCGIIHVPHGKHLRSGDDSNLSEFQGTPPSPKEHPFIRHKSTSAQLILSHMSCTVQILYPGLLFEDTCCVVPVNLPMTSLIQLDFRIFQM